jgi:hypothetical protein
VLNVDELAVHFERRLHEQLAALPRFPNEAAMTSKSEHPCEHCGPIRTFGDARCMLETHALVLAHREAEILSRTAVALRLVSERDLDNKNVDYDGVEIRDDQVPTVVGGWPWTVWGEERPEHLGLPCVLREVLAVAGLADHAVHEDVDLDELAAWLASRCPEGVVNYSTKTRNGSTLGEFVPDCHPLAVTLLAPSYNVSKEQISWLYVNVLRTVDRAGLRPIHQATHITLFLGSIARGDAQRRLLDVIVPAALKNACADERVGDERVRDDLASAVRRHVSRFMEHLKKQEHPEVGCEATKCAIGTETTDSEVLQAEILRALYADLHAVAERLAQSFDEGFASYVEGLGKEGKKLAIEIRRNSGKRVGAQLWRLWRYCPEGERFLVCLAQVLWIEEVRAETKHREAHRLPGVVRATMLDRMLVPMTQQVSLPLDDDDLKLSGGEVRDERGRVLGTVSLTTDATLAAVRSGCAAFGTVHGHLLFRALIHRAADWWSDKVGVQDARPRIRFRGGWNGLLDELGIARKFHQRIKDIAVAGQCIVWSTPTITAGGLWTWAEDRGTRAGAGEVAFVLGDALTPGYASDLKRSANNSHAARLARRVVPELRFAPPMGGARSNDHGPIWTLHRLLMVELVDRAEALHVDGAVEITPARWLELADSARLPRRILSRTLDAWVRGESQSAPALLDRVCRDGWTLASSHQIERDYIAAGGARRVSGRRHAQARLRRR